MACGATCSAEVSEPRRIGGYFGDAPPCPLRGHPRHEPFTRRRLRQLRGRASACQAQTKRLVKGPGFCEKVFQRVSGHRAEHELRRQKYRSKTTETTDSAFTQASVLRKTGISNGGPNGQRRDQTGMPPACRAEANGRRRVSCSLLGLRGPSVGRGQLSRLFLCCPRKKEVDLI